MSIPIEEEQFFSEFIHDLYAEYEERLTTVRHILLTLEQHLPQNAVDDTALDTLLRHLHTLKGLAGTINLGDAEELTHQAEQYLRLVRQKEMDLTPLGMEILVTALNNLEHMIGAHQAQQPIPFNAQVLNALLRLIGPPNNSTEISSTAQQSVVSVQRSDTPEFKENQPYESPKIAQLWRFEFTPQPSLAEKGINVNQIRARLESIGELQEAKPCLPQHGGPLAFQFLLKTTASESEFAQWTEEGISYQLVDNGNAGVLNSTVSDSTVSDTPPNPESLLQAANNELDPALTTASMVRVEMARLDELMRMVGELVTARSRQQNLFKQLRTTLPHQQWRHLQDSNNQLERQLRSLREAIMRVRMVPIGTAFERMKFVVRDLVKHSHKQVQLTLQGPDTQIDKIMVDQLLDPLLHLVRNAISHGIEPVEQRIQAHKPPQGQLLLSAGTAGDAVIIRVADDGRGIDVDLVTAHARQRGLIAPEARVDHSNLLTVLCHPGFSTQPTADHTSGRGLGMDIVRRTLSKLGGTLQLKTELGAGTQFTLQLPLTLAIIDALIVEVGSQIFAIPQLSVQEVLEIPHHSSTAVLKQDIIRSRNEVLLLVHLSQLFSLAENPSKHGFYALVVNDNLAIVVDRVHGQQEIVVQGLSDPWLQLAGISGATELGNGKLILILDPATLTLL